MTMTRLTLIEILTNPDKINNFDNLQIVTRFQKHSIVNNRDQIFMHKENYLYFMSADGKPCDNGSKNLQERKLIPRITNAQTGKVTFVKKGNKIHLILICKDKINDKVIKETLNQLSISLHETLSNTPTKIMHSKNSRNCKQFLMRFNF